MKQMKKAANIKSLGLVGYGVATVKFITLFLSLALTISSLGVFAAKNRDFYNTFKSLGDYCVLFASIENEAILSSNDNCNYVIAGQTIASGLIIGCIVVLVLGKIVDTKQVVFNIVLLLFAVLALIMSTVAAIVLSAGLKSTCNAVEKEPLRLVKCSDAEIKIPLLNINITFYDSVLASIICGWIGVLFLIVAIFCEIGSLILNLCSLSFKSKYNVLRK